MTITSAADRADLGAVPTKDGDRPFPWPWFAALAVAIFAAEVAWTWPTRMDFRGYYFGDPGANLAVQDLIRRGLRPTIDFIYQYGLLALLFGRGWFALFGDTALAYRASGIAFGVWMIASLTQFVRAQRIGPAGAAILLVGLPFFVPSSQPNFTHGLESALLCQALAEQARGRRATALALATAAVLSKPSLGFVFGLILLILTVASLRGRLSARTLLGAEGLGPAIVTGLVLLAVLAAVYGVEPVIRTVFPTAGLANYRAANFGFFFGIGRMFWHPPGAGPGYYLGTVVGFWIVGSLTLVVAGLVSAFRLAAARDRPSAGEAPAAELVATCALAHAAFVTALFGHAFTWPYDSYVLGVGLASLTRLGLGWRRWAWLLVALAAVGNRSNLTAPLDAWRGRSPDAGIAGLWESPEARAEWGEVLDLTRGHRWVLLAVSGSGELWAPGVAPPETFFLMAGMGEAPEIRRKAGQLAETEVVVIPKAFDNLTLASWPEFTPILERLDVVHDGALYRVYRRNKPAAKSPAAPEP